METFLEVTARMNRGEVVRPLFVCQLQRVSTAYHIVESQTRYLGYEFVICTQRSESPSECSIVQSISLPSTGPQ